MLKIFKPSNTSPLSNWSYLPHKLCGSTGDVRCVWLRWISGHPCRESLIHVSLWAGGCKHYINIPEAFFGGKAITESIDTVLLKDENTL